MVNNFAEIFELGEHEIKFHPVAVKNYREFVSDLQSAVDLTEITEADVKAYLNASDCKQFLDILDDIFGYLAKNKLTKDFTARDITAGILWTYGFKTLLKRVSTQKAHWKILKKAESDRQFQAYLATRREIQKREEARVQLEKARAEHQEFVKNLNISLGGIKARLAKEKEPGFDNYPDWLHSYKPSLWCKLFGPPKDWMTIEMAAKVIIQKALLPAALLDHINTKLTYGAWYVPGVRYELVAPPPSPQTKGHPAKPGTGVPCLRWHMATFILTTAEFWLDDGPISDERHGYVFDGRFEPENLGKFYDGPVFWKSQDAFVTPLSLLALLAWEKGGVPGVEVIKMENDWTTYRTSGFLEVTLHDDFIRFIRDMTKKTPLGKALLKRDLSDEKTAGLVAEKMAELQKPEDTATVPGKPSEPKSTGDDYTNMYDNLTHQMGYKDAEAKAAAKFACEKYPKETLVNKIKIAVQYLSK